MQPGNTEPTGSAETGPYTGSPEAGWPTPGVAQPGPWAPGPPPYVLRRPTNGMAIAAMITGIVSLLSCPLIGFVAVYLAKRAREEIRTRGEDGEGFATAGLVIGWIGVALGVLSLLAVLAYFGILGAVYFAAFDAV